MILLLGASGYVGSAFAEELRVRKRDFIGLSRKDVDYTDFGTLLSYLKRNKPEFVVNAAGYTGVPNVDACENARADTLWGNTLFPQMLAQACLVAGIPWGHVSSGCIYTGAKIVAGSDFRVEKDLTEPALQALIKKNPTFVQGFSESDPPNFSFREPPCSFYSGTKALGEEAISKVGQSYLWRLRIPFDRFDNHRNYLTKLQKYARVYDNVNSLSHRGDFVRACLDLWEKKAPFGTYNVTNPGFVTAREVIEMIQKWIAPERRFEFWTDDAEFYRLGAKTPRSNCVLDVSKTLAAGVELRPVRTALEDSLKNWQKSSQ